MAQAVAGETAKPFVFVDPGAFIQMFMGVGILKVKSLYRKLRQLARPLRRRDRVLRRSRLARQPGVARRQGGGWSSARAGIGARPRLQRRSPTSHATRRGDAVVALGDRCHEAPDHHGHGHGRRRRDGHAAGAPVGDVRAEEAARVRQPARAAAARHEAEAPTEVPDPPHLRDEHAPVARPGDAPSRPHRPHLQGRLPVEGGPQAPRTTTTSPRSSTSSRRTTSTSSPR